MKTYTDAPLLLREIEAARYWVRDSQRRGLAVGLVPTMGALHEGHLSLVRAAREHNDVVVVTIFVNPTQFGPGEDYEQYPRPLEDDLARLMELGAHAVFAPSVETMYPDGEILTYVIPDRIDQNLCGLSRPGHFRGVCSVVAKLFNILPADRAFFGRKDAQQAAILTRMASDLNFPIEIVVCPIVREADGLAMSSRNKYLGPEERRQALALSKALARARDILKAGQTDSRALIAEMSEELTRYPLVVPEYASVVDPETIQDIPVVESQALLAVAAQVGPARLIDNLFVDLERGLLEL